MNKRAPDLMEMLRALIAAPSVSSVNPEFDMGNRAVIDLLASWLDALGFGVEILPVDSERGKTNLVARLGEGEGGLVLSGHTDTVPFDEGAWQHDPFRLVEASDRVYGLGTSDMKSFFALVIHAVRDLAPGRLRHPLVVVATADEESSMNGARALVQSRQPLGSFALIGEPTNLKPVHAHKGVCMESISILGRSGHSSDPGLGASALEGMHLVIGELLRWREQLQRLHRDPRFTVPVPTLNLGRIHGGDNPNRICAACELQIDLRPLPGMDLQTLRTTLQQRVRESLDSTGLQVTFQSLFEGISAMETDPQSPIVRAAEDLCGQPAGAAAFATEAPFLNELGAQTVVLGPGDVAQAHQPDEYLSLERIEPMVRILHGLIDRFCYHARQPA